MALMKVFHLLLELHVLVILFLFPHKMNHDFSTLNRNSFPPNFIFGTASSSYQYEGAYNEDGRGLSIWDTFTHQYPEKMIDGGNGDVALDHYHRYKEDVRLMKEMGMDAYRFSISWSRLLPNGKLNGGVNRKGIQFYNDLIDEILSNGLQPYVTLFHWDVPQGLEDEYGGFLSSHIVRDFQDYVELCYKEFGDRVKHWITLNEPWSFSNHGYNEGDFAPGRCSKCFKNCTNGNSATEPYIVTHNQLLAHAAAVNVYKQKYQDEQKGKIGITLVCYWMEPLSQVKNDKDAARRALDFMLGWYMDPLTYGDYPKSMWLLVRDRLPQFSIRESEMLKGSYDFIGINYYTAKYVADVPFHNDIFTTYTTDSLANLTNERNGILIGPATASNWLYVYPKGFKDLLLYVRETYNNPVIYITENGVGETINSSKLEEALSDNMRINYCNQHLKFLLEAINEGADVRGYFAWSLLDNFEWSLDNFEWSDGYTVRFGVNYVDFKTMKRYPKQSSIWFNKFLNV